MMTKAQNTNSALLTLLVCPVSLSGLIYDKDQAELVSLRTRLAFPIQDGVPIMMTEVMLGRRGRRNPVDSMKHLAEETGHWQVWKFLGWMGIAAGFLILSYYKMERKAHL